ncbi:hypothetical protein GGQ91_002475 [Methylobacterium fujisawaense]|uniref:Uncharacterized protein n=1 Tax=Methylobacterium fujisawaense TaxID=107400 RepID=A0ABR6DBC7_9HYPH|nr:hypothetical protein [Methylobacterium fujisawaense]MBA9063087.1 hypothetical protein [Methylobacterium fujisawaense]
MSCAVRPAPDHQAFIALIDRHPAAFGVPSYSELVHAVHEQDQRASEFYGALRAAAENVRAAQILIAQAALDQPRDDMLRDLVEALKHATAASMVANIALFTAETRVDLDGRDDVTVLADARTRLRAAGRRL